MNIGIFQIAELLARVIWRAVGFALISFGLTICVVGSLLSGGDWEETKFQCQDIWKRFVEGRR